MTEKKKEYRKDVRRDETMNERSKVKKNMKERTKVPRNERTKETPHRFMN